MFLDCDQVFEVLTRGPFPTGAASDVIVEAHLSECADCARLAAALRPALELFQETIDVDQRHSLPSYWGEVAVEFPKPVNTPAILATPRRQERHVDHQPPESNWTMLNVWGLAASLALGVFLGSLWHSNHSSPSPEQNSRTSAGNSSRGNTGSVVIASLPGEAPRRLSLPLACLEKKSRTNSLKAPIPLMELACCTDCHNSASTVAVPRAATAVVSSLCRGCHED